MWRINEILQQFKTFAPEIFEYTQKDELYDKAPKISIDYAIMEKIDPRMVNVMPAELGWNDIGNWAALHDELTQKETENISVGRHLAVNTEGSVVIGNSQKLIVTQNLKNMIIIDTPEALLVMPKEDASDVKKIIEELKKQKQEKFL